MNTLISQLNEQQFNKFLFLCRVSLDLLEVVAQRDLKELVVNPVTPDLLDLLDQQ